MTLGTVMKEKDEEIALFFEMRRLENERSNHSLLHNSDEFDAPLGSKRESSPTFKILSSPHAHRTGAVDFLNSDDYKNDYDWLLTPPGTPLFLSLEKESQKTALSQNGTPKALPTAQKSRLQLANPTASRSATPTVRPTLQTTAKPSRASTPTSRATLPSSKPMAPPAKSSTPSGRSSTPTARPTVLASKTTSRSATPTGRPSIALSLSSVSAPHSRSSSMTKLRPTTKRNLVASRCNSTEKSRPNLKISMPERPLSASRSRPGATNAARSSSVEACLNRKPNRQSCFPSSGRTPNGSIHSNGSFVSAMNRTHSNGNDDVNPVLMGTQMVERIINMRKLAPPKQDDQCTLNNPTGKSSSSQNSSGFGRTLSKKSLDMALRHMDIRRSMPGGNPRPLTTNIPASSMYSVRSGKSRTSSVSDSPHASSSNGSSELSINSNNISSNGSEVEDDDIGSERGVQSTSPSSQHDQVIHGITDVKI